MTGPGWRLILLRHAKSARPDGVADHSRPLADRGRTEAPLAGRWLRDNVADIDLVVCSTAARARETWELVSDELGAHPDTRDEDRLYAASGEELLAVARQLPDRARTALFVAHNPGLEDLVSLLTGSDQELKTSAIAVLDGTDRWADSGPGWAQLTTVATPR